MKYMKRDGENIVINRSNLAWLFNKIFNQCKDEFEVNSLRYALCDIVQDSRDEALEKLIRNNKKEGGK